RADFQSARSTPAATIESPDTAPSLATSCARASLMSAQITRAPLRANSSTVALPMPDAPPVISAVLPSSLIPSLPCSKARAPSPQLTREKRRHALARLGIGREPPRLFELVAKAAGAVMVGHGDASLAGAQRRRRQAGD